MKFSDIRITPLLEEMFSIQSAGLGLRSLTHLLYLAKTVSDSLEELKPVQPSEIIHSLLSIDMSRLIYQLHLNKSQIFKNHRLLQVQQKQLVIHIVFRCPLLKFVGLVRWHQTGRAIPSTKKKTLLIMSLFKNRQQKRTLDQISSVIS